VRRLSGVEDNRAKFQVVQAIQAEGELW
jgi:hypothetical protein